MSKDKVFLFDMDGVILLGSGTDSYVYQKATEKALEQFDIDNIEPKHVEALKTGGSTFELLKKTCDEIGINYNDFWYYKEEFASEIENQAIRDGQKTTYADSDTIKKISEGYQTGIVSNNRISTVEFVHDYVYSNELDVATARYPIIHDYKRRKPKPDYLQRAIKSLEITPETEVYYTGDKEKDIIAGRNADVQTIYMKRPHNYNKELSIEPDYEIDSLHQIKEKIID